MGAKLKQPPDGYDVVKSTALGGKYLILTFERDAKGKPVEMGWLGAEDGPNAPLLFAKRAAAVNAAILHQITTERDHYRALVYHDETESTSMRRAVGV